MGIAKKNLAKAVDDYLAKEGCLEDPFSKQILRNYQPCVSTPKLLNNTKNVSIKTTLSITTLAQYVYPATRKDHPMNNHERL